jgi:hypothetical protein
MPGMKNTYRLILIGVMIFLFSLPVSSSYIWFGYRSPETKDHLCYPVQRKYYPLRHWTWSGLPGEGGFISDPHFLWSEPMPFPDPVLRTMNSKNAGFQVMDVNPFFNDGSSEILLLIESNNIAYEYRLQFPRYHNAQAILATPDLPSVRAFPFSGKIALAANFENVKGIYLLSLPLKTGTTLQLIPANTPEFELIAAQLGLSSREKTVKTHFCDTSRNDFIAFYEKYGGLCEKEKANSVLIDERFAEFWK